MINIEIPHKVEFNKFNETRQNFRTAYDLSIWPNWVPNDEYQVAVNEFWYLDDVLNILGVQNKQKYTNFIALSDALIDNTPKKLLPENSQDKNKLIHQHVHIPNKTSEIEMTRYACWTLMKSMEQSTTFFQEYFMNPNMELLALYRTAFCTSRIPLRAQLTKLNTQLNGIFASVGANNPSQFAGYNREKTETLFGGKTKINIIKNRHLLPNVNTPKNNTFAQPSNTHLVDYMNTWLLNTYITAIKNIIFQWDQTSRPYRNYTTLRDITHNEMKRARGGFIKQYESTPEENISPYGIKTIEYYRHLHEMEFTKKFIKSKIR